MTELIVAAIILGLFLLVLEIVTRIQLRRYRTMSQEAREKLLERMEGYRDSFHHRVLGIRRIDWYWAAINTSLGIAMTLGIGMVYLTLRGYHNGIPISGVDITVMLLIMSSGIFAYMRIRKYRINNYNCPSCGKNLLPRPEPASNLAYLCSECNLYWDVLDRNSWY